MVWNVGIVTIVIGSIIGILGMGVMEKKNFITLVLGIVSGLIFALGMCMCLLPEWNMFNLGVGCTAVGLVAIIVTVIAYRKMFSALCILGI